MVAPRASAATDEERRRLELAEREAAQEHWDVAFGEFQVVLDSVRARQDRELERRLWARFADLLERSGDRARAEVTRGYLARGFREPTGHARLRREEPNAARGDETRAV
jgi:hypothetical protein